MVNSPFTPLYTILLVTAGDPVDGVIDVSNIIVIGSVIPVVIPVARYAK